MFSSFRTLSTVRWLGTPCTTAYYLYIVCFIVLDMMMFIEVAIDSLACELYMPHFGIPLGRCGTTMVAATLLVAQFPLIKALPLSPCRNKHGTQIFTMRARSAVAKLRLALPIPLNISNCPTLQRNQTQVNGTVIDLKNTGI